MAYYWFKAFHIIGVVVWFAGLFYLVRLFIYHVEAQAEPEPAQSILKGQYAIMEKRLYNIITTPGMIVTVAMAVALLWAMPEYLQNGWMHAKLGLVAVLLGYHFYCGRLMKMVTIVMLVVFKNNFPTTVTPWLIFGLIIVMAATIQLYARKRRLDKEKANAVDSPETQALQQS